MSFWQRLFGPRRRKEPEKRRSGQRGKARTGRERLEMMEAQYLTSLKRHDRAQYNRLMEAQYRRRHNIGEQESEISRLTNTLGEARALADLLNGKKEGEGGGWLKEAIQGAMLILQEQQRQVNAVPVVQPIPQAQVEVVQPTAAPAAPELPQAGPAYQVIQEPRPVAATQPVEAPAASANGHHLAGLPSRPPSPVSAHLIGQLESKTPEQAAEWLIGQRHAQAKELVHQLCTTPDDRLGQLLEGMVAARPDLGGIVAWLGERPDWLHETVVELRRLTNQYPPLPVDLDVGM